MTTNVEALQRAMIGLMKRHALLMKRVDVLEKQQAQAQQAILETAEALRRSGIDPAALSGSLPSGRGKVPDRQSADEPSKLSA